MHSSISFPRRRLMHLRCGTLFCVLPLLLFRHVMTYCATDDCAGNRMMPSHVPCYGTNGRAFGTTRRLRVTDYDAH